MSLPWMACPPALNAHPPALNARPPALNTCPPALNQLLLQLWESIPTFEEKIPAYLPLRRSQEVDYRLHQVELLTQPTNDKGCLRAACTTCLLCTDVCTWGEFKARTRHKFCGTCSAAAFLDVLATNCLEDCQSPANLHMEIECVVDYAKHNFPDELENPENVICQKFLQGIPLNIQEVVTVKNQGSLKELASAKQQVWDVRQRIHLAETSAHYSHPDHRYPRYDHAPVASLHHD